MKCERVRDNLAEYQLGGLGEEWRGEIARHLEGCADCRAELAALERLDDLLTPAERVGAPADLWSRIQPRLQPRRAPWWQSLLASPRPAIAAAAAMLLAGVGIWLATRGPVTTVQPEALASSYQERQIVAEWSSPLADDAALGLMFAGLNGDVIEQ